MFQLQLLMYWCSFYMTHKYSQGSDYEEFVKTAAADNEIQFVETSNFEVAKVLYPDIKSTDHFLGIVKSEPDRYTGYGELVILQ